MRKRDSIEFLWDELKPFLPANYTVDESVKIISILKQAKAMHKEEVRNAHTHGRNVERGIVNNGIFTAEQYYNETFGE